MEHVLLLILAVFGFGISWFIWYKKSHHEKLVCVIAEDCNKVVKSKYATFLGIDNTIMGMLYYLLVFAASVLQFFFPSLFVLSFMVWGKIVISASAALFSVYLTFVQLAILKDWCEYCLASAALSVIIFMVVVL